MTKSNRRTPSEGSRGGTSPGSRSGTSPGERGSYAASGSARAGRRPTPRRRYDEPSALERFRGPLIALAVIAAVALVGGFLFLSAGAPAYACSTTLTVEPPTGSRLGQVQPDMGANHINAGERARYTYCPPASGDHVNRPGFGPIEPGTYGPDDRSEPMGWIHNLEHGALVILYACDQGACTDEALATVRDFGRTFDAVSAICQVPPRFVGPVIARFEQMPTPYAALVWGRVLFMEQFDAELAERFFLEEGERLSEDGTRFVAPPEAQCAPPSPTPTPTPSASPAASATPAPSGSPAASPTPASPVASPTPAPTSS